MSDISTLLFEKEILDEINTGEYRQTTLTLEEKKVLMGVKDIEVYFRFKSKSVISNNILPPVIQIEVKCDLTPINSKTTKKDTFTGVEDIILESLDKEEVVEHEGKRINVRPTLLAVLYSIIPLDYNKAEVEETEIDGIEFISEEEYNRRKSNNPFKDLNIEDFE